MKKIRYWIQKKFPTFYKNLINIFMCLKKYTSREKKKTYGNKNKDKIIYIIRIRRENLGLMGYYMSVLGHIKYAIENNYIPVVDMKNYKNTYLSKEDFGIRNSWEYYFKQPCDITLEEAYSSKNVILSNLETPKESDMRYFYYNCYSSSAMLDYYNIIEKYIKYNDKIEKKLSEQYNNLLKNKQKNAKILGVICRGTDIVGFPGHSKQPTINELISEVSNVFSKDSYKYIFLASDTNKNIEIFKKHFGENVIITNSCQRFDCFSESDNNVLSEIHFNRENDNYLKGLEYLTTIYCLSKCDSLYGSLIGGTIAALCLNHGNYDHIYIYDHGIY